jgi:hypothetical protein
MRACEIHRTVKYTLSDANICESWGVDKQADAAPRDTVEIEHNIIGSKSKWAGRSSGECPPWTR